VQHIRGVKPAFPDRTPFAANKKALR
jgi:hypothetical protein